jgi:hypothetical protein
MVLRVKNPGDRDVAIIGTSVRPKVYSVANSWEFDQLVDATLDSSSHRLIFPRQEIELPLSTLVRDGRSLDAEDRNVLIG